MLNKVKGRDVGSDDDGLDDLADHYQEPSPTFTVPGDQDHDRDPFSPREESFARLLDGNDSSYDGIAIEEKFNTTDEGFGTGVGLKLEDTTTEVVVAEDDDDDDDDGDDIVMKDAVVNLARRFEESTLLVPGGSSEGGIRCGTAPNSFAGNTNRGGFIDGVAGTISINEDDVMMGMDLDITDCDDDSNNCSSTTATIEEYFEVGDHIYSWCSLCGIPRVFTHHGIVIDRAQSSVPGTASTVTILDFSCLVYDENNNKHKSSAKSSSMMSSKANIFSTSSVIRTDTTTDTNDNCDGARKLWNNSKNDNSILQSYTISETEACRVWNKVKYQATIVEKYFTRRAGTVSRRKSDSVETILARTQFLLQNRRHNTTILATYDTIQSNCEHSKSKCRSQKNKQQQSQKADDVDILYTARTQGTHRSIFHLLSIFQVAVWCKTGQYSSLQLVSAMDHSVAVSTVPTLVASTATTTIPAGGLWGWCGYTTTVSLVSVLPWLLPVVSIPSAVLMGKSVFDRTRWQQITTTWNAVFEDWKHTLDQPLVNSTTTPSSSSSWKNTTSNKETPVLSWIETESSESESSEKDDQHEQRIMQL